MAKELTPQDFGLSPNDPLLQEQGEEQRPVDQRSLCHIKGCEERAWALVSWPRRYPVPMCQAHAEEIYAMVQKPPFKFFRPADWLRLLKEVGKPALFGRS